MKEIQGKKRFNLSKAKAYFLDNILDPQYTLVESCLDKGMCRNEIALMLFFGCMEDLRVQKLNLKWKEITDSVWTTWQDFLGKVGTAIDKIKESRKQNNDDST